MHAHIQIKYTFCMQCSYITYLAKFSLLYCCTCIIWISLIMKSKAKGVRRVWVGDYDTLPQFISSVKSTCTAVYLTLQNINKLAVQMNIIVVNFFQSKWDNNHIIIFTSHSFLVCILQGQANSSEYRSCKFSPSIRFRAPEDSGHTMHRWTFP